ncbi:MAG: aminoglycoside phosphotransferase family protein [Ruminococcaceae bacterium]|nr:aminoglycoside phosphotransferase family protein [Oscillospiraceae bacterium]
MERINNITKACKAFLEFDTIEEIENIPNGHINATDRVKINGRNYILQRINTTIFKDPVGLMNNISSVTEFCRNKIIEANGDPDRETLTLLKANDGKFYHENENGFYRMYLFITDATCYNKAEKAGMFGESAKAFGRFQNLLAEFDATVLTESIKDFHNTPVRFQNLLNAIEADKAGRVAECKDEIDFYLARKEFCSVITDRLADGRLPTRVTHNDTKLNNVMIDDVTGSGICVIDLDTIMPGSMLYDFGDSIRFGASSAAEDEKDLSKVYCVPELYEEYAAGFLGEMKGTITEEEVKQLHNGAIMMTLECGMRFLTDYLEGDTYFRTHYEGQNLDRTRTQLTLVKDMEARRDLFEGIIKKYI